MNNCIVPFERVYRAGALLSKFPARDLRKKGFVMSVRIITDSASDMTPAEHPALRVLPLSVTFGTDVYMDGVDIDHQRFYEMLVERDELPKTGQVNQYAFSQAIAEAREAGDEAVIITVGAKLSGTNQSARTALAEAPGGDVFVVDSNNVTLGERVLVEYALRLVDEGRSAAQIAAAVEAVRDRVVVIGLLETLEYLVRGGRLSAAAGAVGTLLNVKPVVAAEDGLIVQLGKARGSKNGRNLLNQKVEQAGGVDFSMPLALGYTGLSDAVLKKYIEDSAALWAGHAENELPIHTIGATIGTHVGPGAVAVAFSRQLTIRSKPPQMGQAPLWRFMLVSVERSACWRLRAFLSGCTRWSSRSLRGWSPRMVRWRCLPVVHEVRGTWGMRCTAIRALVRFPAIVWCLPMAVFARALPLVGPMPSVSS